MVDKNLFRRNTKWKCLWRTFKPPFYEITKKSKQKKEKILSVTKAFEGSIALRFDRKKINNNKTKRKTERENENCAVDWLVLNARLAWTDSYIPVRVRLLLRFLEFNLYKSHILSAKAPFTSAASVRWHTLAFNMASWHEIYAANKATSNWDTFQRDEISRREFA